MILRAVLKLPNAILGYGVIKGGLSSFKSSNCSEASREVTNLTERKNTHLYNGSEFCLFIIILKIKDINGGSEEDEVVPTAAANKTGPKITRKNSYKILNLLHVSYLYYRTPIRYL